MARGGEAVSYEAWRISYQSSEQAARAAYAEIERLRNDLADALDCKAGAGPTALLMLIQERDTLPSQLAAAETRAEGYRTALQKLACLGNGDEPGNSIGNCIAQTALAEWGGR